MGKVLTHSMMSMKTRHIGRRFDVLFLIKDLPQCGGSDEHCLESRRPGKMKIINRNCCPNDH